MPNIAMYGFSCLLPGELQEAEALWAKIWEALAGMKDIDEMVGTFVDSAVQNRKGENMPFLRVYYTPETMPHELEEILRRLDGLDLDIEVMKLESFRLKRSAREILVEKLKTLRPTAGTDPDFDYAQGEPKAAAAS
jgi:hypothetical protein